MNSILLIIPAFNEQENIEYVVDNIINNYPQYDYVVVNDGSADNTRKILARKGYNYLDLPVNTGLAGAFRAGIKYANAMGYDYAVQFDGDGQHRCESIEVMFNKMLETNADVVVGSRYIEKRRDHSLRNMGSRLITAAILFRTGKFLKDPTSGLRLYNKRIIKMIGYNIAYSPEPDTLAYLMKCGARVEEVQVTMDDRLHGKSYLNLGRSIKYMITVLMNTLLLQWFRKKVSLK